MGPGDRYFRSFTVLVPNDLVTGTLLINDRYRTLWEEETLTVPLSVTGTPVTTTIMEVGLIDSYKEVYPQIARPGPDNVLTYTIHVVNSGPHNLSGVQVYDWLPWQSSTYQRDAIASTGAITDDIVSVLWSGDVAPYSEETITLTVLVDNGFSGAITNTAVITHALLRAPVVVDTIAYISDEPVLKIQKTASPDPVYSGDELLYTIQVTNMGQTATQVVITDSLPTNVEYVYGSGSAGGTEVNGGLRWELLLLQPGESAKVTFRVIVGRGREVINENYRVSCFEGVTADGPPVITIILDGGFNIYLPLLLR
jgi:uncharacterized repeat protein (TIGR01451 family)